MQVLKKEIQESIVKTATRMFYDQGFEKTTTRQIADEVQMSVSNLYKYFKNKEDIFSEIINGYYRDYMDGFSKFVSHDGDDSFEPESNSFLARTIFESIRADHVKFVLLMDKSEGTQYAGFKNEVIAMLGKHIITGAQIPASHEFIVKILVGNFFHGIVEIAKNYRNDQWAFNNISLLTTYHMRGIASLYNQ